MTLKARPWGQVSLRPLDQISVETFKTWQNDPDIRNRTMGFRFPVNSLSASAWLEDSIKKVGSSASSFSIFYRDSSIGACFLEDIDWVNRTTRFGIYIGEKSVQGKGVGYCACVLALDFAFSGINLQRIELNVVDTNTAAISLYKSLGFVQEGVARKAFMLKGEARNVLQFGLLSDEFLVDCPPEANRLA